MHFLKAVLDLFPVLCLILFGFNEAVNGASEADAIIYLKELDTRFSTACNTEKQARWEYVTNVTAETQANSVSKYYAVLIKSIVNCDGANGG